jgi:glucose/mannose-6-phosphate isomerase
MQNVTDLDAIKKIDPQDSYRSTEMMVEQLKAAWDQVNALEINIDDAKVKNIIFCGMGASIYGALVIKALLGHELSYPTEVITDYHLPAYANEESLVILTSYSGSTEEVLSCADEALAKGAQMIVLTKGGKLAEFAKTNNVPAYIFDGVLNPAGTPRLGNGYTILGLIGLLSKAGIITVEDREIKDALTRLEENKEDIKKKALVDFEIFENKIPIVIGAEHLSGNTQILRNQFNETSKTFSALYLVPDLNHHLMEGLRFPKNTQLHFLFLNSGSYSPKIQKRMTLTMEVVKQNEHVYHEFLASGSSVYDDFLETLLYGSYLTLFLAIRYDQDPAINPFVDWFKAELSK